MEWSAQVKALVWAKAEAVPDFDAAEFRKDACGAWIGWNFYDDRFSTFGWGIDYIAPIDDDSPSNLRALQWDNLMASREGTPRCPVTSQGSQNIRRW